MVGARSRRERQGAESEPDRAVLAADTIAAIASPPGPGERGVVRVSGPLAGEIAAGCVRADGPVPPPARGLVTGRLDDGSGEQPVLLLWMPGPRSYTREDVAELHLPGSPPLLSSALERVLALGARAARPGEFTRRAFQSGRIDLLRAEGVLELVTAGGREEVRAGAALLAGGLSARIEELRTDLIALLALCEASLDFDESETGHVDTADLLARSDAVSARLGEALSWEERRVPASGRPRAVLFGAPNAGKSTLFNALVGEAAALVDGRSGATRDGVGGALTLGEVECELLDAPGLAAAATGPDAAAQALSARERAGADLVLWVADAASATAARLGEEARRLPPGAAVLLVWSQIDRENARPAPPGGLVGALAPAVAQVEVSARTGEGLPALRERAARCLGLAGGAAAGTGAGRELAARHRAALARARAEVDGARAGIARDAPLDLAAQGLRGALARLDDVCGHTTPEEVLDELFARFCIGK